MTEKNIYSTIVQAVASKTKLLAILLDPDKFDLEKTAEFLRKIPSETTHILVGGSTVPAGKTEMLVKELKFCTAKPIVLFPGDVSQLTGLADALLFLSLFSGNNPEYLVGQQTKSVPILRKINLEVIPTGYILLDGGNHSAVAQVTRTLPIPQSQIQRIVDISLAAQLAGKKLIYLEAGSGAKFPVQPGVISKVKKTLNIPLIVGGGIRSEEQKQAAFTAGADMVVMGTAFENNSL